MNVADYTTCAYCPRLCRHVCPVAVATGRESATPTAMMTVPLLAARGDFTAADALAGTDLCLGCGACTSHCKVDVPVAARLSAWRAPQITVSPEPLRTIEGEGSVICVLTEDEDWSGLWAARVGAPVARLRTADELGHAAWRAGAESVLVALSAHVGARELLTGSGLVEEVARAAGVSVTRLPFPASEHVYSCCHEGPRPGPEQLACCGRREGFPARQPEAARLVAVENVRLLAGAHVTCADEGCTRWLRAHGASVTGPQEALSAERNANGG